MADWIIGLDRGEGQSLGTRDASSVTKDIEIVIDLAVGLEKHEAVDLITRMRDEIAAGDWPLPDLS